MVHRLGTLVLNICPTEPDSSFLKVPEGPSSLTLSHLFSILNEAFSAPVCVEIGLKICTLQVNNSRLD